MFLSLLRLWTGPLPHEELFPDRKINPFVHWFIHPIKRRFAKYYLFTLQHFFGLKVIAITGSTGKTTTANMLYSVLSLVGPTVKTVDSITSTYNIPTTILECTRYTKYLILEMGVEYAGDMDFYCWLAKPDIGVLLNVSPVHASYLGSLENIRAEKSKLLRYSKIGLTATDFPKIISSEITPNLKTKIIMDIRNSKLDQLEIHLSLIGTHFAQNVSTIFAIASKLQIPVGYIISGLESVLPALHRFNPINLTGGNLLIDDTYNSNPLSAAASIETLAEIAAVTKKTPILIFSQMNELGSYEKAEHEKLGLFIRKLGITHLFCIGPAAKYVIDSAGYGKYFDTQDKLLTALQKLVICDLKFVILVKGSRSWHLENLLEKIKSLN
jgi:UDP-N-acetylmuramoyl-tripeptide--D-alanyl-D-alanine ligase